MSLLIIGIAVFTLAHLSLSVAPGIKTGMVNVMSDKAFKGLFALIVLTSLITIVIGWRRAGVEYAYVSSYAMRHVTMLFMLIAFILFGAAKGATDIQRFIRHPMLTAVLIWAVAHLLSNGEIRSIVLFASMGVWAVLEMVFINKREGEWIKPAPAPAVRTLKNIVISLVMFVVIFALHKYITGISLMPGG